jgi:phosphate starvation-inducible protein PhoH and related proteins
VDAINVLDGVEGISFCHFADGDVVRHALVQRIVRAYEAGKPQQQELPLSMGETMQPPAAEQQGTQQVAALPGKPQ